MKTVKSVNPTSFATYGGILAAFWVLVFGLVYWILGWIFGASAWWIDMNLGSWSAYTLVTFIAIFIRALIAFLAGALGGLVVAWVYNFVASVMGGLKINLE